MESATEQYELDIARRTARRYFRLLWIAVAGMLLLGGLLMWLNYRNRAAKEAYLLQSRQTVAASHAFFRAIMRKVPAPPVSREVFESLLPDPQFIRTRRVEGEDLMVYSYRDPTTGGVLDATFAEGMLRGTSVGSAGSRLPPQPPMLWWILEDGRRSAINWLPIVWWVLLAVYIVWRHPSGHVHVAFLMLLIAIAYAIATAANFGGPWGLGKFASFLYNDRFIWAILGNICSVVLVWLTIHDIRDLDTSRCSKCGYDLRATPQRCPECGTEADAQSLTSASAREGCDASSSSSV